MNSTLKIGYVVRMFPRFSETFVLQEILELERRGVEVTVFSLNKPNEGRFHPALSRLAAPVIYLDDHEARKWGSWLAGEWPELAPHRDKLWKCVEEAALGHDAAAVDTVFHAALLASRGLRLGLHALHAHFATVSCTLAYEAHRISGIPFSFTAHAKDIFTDTVDRTLLTAKINAARFVVTVSQYNRRFLIEQHPEAVPDKIRVLYNGVDLDFFSPDKAAQPVTPPAILAIGRLVIKKGFADLVRACALLRDRKMDFRCRIVGQGREEGPLRDLIVSLGLPDHVELCGPRTQDAVRDMMREATILCLPCIRAEDGNQDALPTVLLEAMACGLPVVSTHLSGIPEIIDADQDGLLVAPGDPAALAAALERLLISPDLRARLASAGRRKAEDRFNLRKSVSTLHGWHAESGTGRPDAAAPATVARRNMA
jgi:glycosyltransferase involved in cell wall biosynthesis